jgi:hypothetical protein
MSRAIPWVECNAANQLAAVQAGIDIWVNTCHEVAVSTVRDDDLVEVVYGTLIAAYPGILFLPGIKTGPVAGGAAPGGPTDLDDLASWQQIGRLARRAMAITGSTRYVIENETGWENFTLGTETIDPGTMATCLRELPPGAIWYPAINSTDPAQYARQRAFMDLVVANVPDLALVPFTYSTRDAVADPAALEPMEGYNRAYGRPCLSIAYFMSRLIHDYYWDDDEIVTLANLVADHEFLLYPGQTRWAACASGVTALYTQPARVTDRSSDEPYSALLNGVATRLRNGSGDSGPFGNTDQVKLWMDEAIDELIPSEELRRELSRSVPVALVCDGGNDAGDENSDGTDDRQTVKVYFCSSAPTMEAAVTGNGTLYWGTGAIKHWILSRLLDRTWTIAGWESLKWTGTRPVAVPSVGRAMMVATFATLRQQTS